MKIAVALLLPWLLACQGMPAPAARGDLRPPLRQCNHACPEYYDPVCATVRRHGQVFTETFGNHCFACVPDGEILRLEQGECGKPLQTM